MDAAAELGRNIVSKHQIQPEYGDEQADAGRDAELVSRDQFFRRDHEQDWPPHPVDTHSCSMCDHTYGGDADPDSVLSGRSKLCMCRFAGITFSMPTSYQ